jgi:hypothetical protein
VVSATPSSICSISSPHVKFFLHPKIPPGQILSLPPPHFMEEREVQKRAVNWSKVTQSLCGELRLCQVWFCSKSLS